MDTVWQIAYTGPDRLPHIFTKKGIVKVDWPTNRKFPQHIEMTSLLSDGDNKWTSIDDRVVKKQQYQSALIILRWMKTEKVPGPAIVSVAKAVFKGLISDKDLKELKPFESLGSQL